MRKIVLTYGILAGLIVAVLMVLTFSTGVAGSEVVGYSTMIVSFSMIFFGIRSYRDSHAGGTVTFGRAFLIGLYITIIASVLYVVTWKIYSSIAMPDYMEHYAQQVVDGMKKSGASSAEIAKKTQEMADMKEMLKNPLIEYGMTFLEIFPVGLIVSLICAAILRRKPTRPAAAQVA